MLITINFVRVIESKFQKYTFKNGGGGDAPGAPALDPPLYMNL